MPKAGLEPARHHWHLILSQASLPFHHLGECGQHQSCNIRCPLLIILVVQNVKDRVSLKTVQIYTVFSNLRTIYATISKKSPAHACTINDALFPKRLQIYCLFFTIQNICKKKIFKKIEAPVFWIRALILLYYIMSRSLSSMLSAISAFK